MRILQERPGIGQGRAGMKRRKPLTINQTITQISELSKKIPKAPKIESRIMYQTNSKVPCAINNQF